MSDSANPEKKIIIDEDWKAQAQKEETEMIEEVLHQLRMGFVAVNKS